MRSAPTSAATSISARFLRAPIHVALTIRGPPTSTHLSQYCLSAPPASPAQPLASAAAPATTINKAVRPAGRLLQAVIRRVRGL